MTKQLELKRISDERLDELAVNEVARQIEFGYEPSYLDMVIVGSDVQLQADQQVLDNVKQAIFEDVFNEALNVMEGIRKLHEADRRLERITSDVIWEFRTRWQALKKKLGVK